MSDPGDNVPGEPHPGFDNGQVADLSPGYIPGEPDEGFANGTIPDSHAVNSAAVGSSNADPVESFDPAEHTVDEVLAHVEEHPDDRDKVVAAEQSGKGRVTLLGALAPEADDED